MSVTIGLDGQVILKKTEPIGEYDIHLMAYYDAPEDVENVTRTVKVTAT